MDANDNNSKPSTPPYGAYKTFVNGVRSLAHDGRVVDRVDSSAVPNMSGSAKKLFLLSLEYFDLIAEDGSPSDQMKRMAINGDDVWKAEIRSLLEGFYSKQIPILDRGTPQQLRESFGEIPSSTVTPAVRFLIHAAEDAGINVNPIIKKNRGGGRSAPRKNKRGQSAANSGGGGPAEPPPSTPDPDGKLSMKELVVKKFPDFDPTWDEARQAAWFSAYEKLLKMAENE